MTRGYDTVLDVDLLGFERGSSAVRRAVVDGVMRSLGTGFVYTSHDIAASLLDDAYGAARRVLRARSSHEGALGGA